MTAPGAPAAPVGNDNTTLFGVLGIILGICCWPAGLVFAILSLNAAKKFGNQPTLAYVAFVVVALNLILGIIGWTAGWFSVGDST
jgi:F0F1-type ATP synthase membrane subunit c/vacuolar-type H+-ATPase subunit K